ncbi:glycogen synthase GlgA [Halanaerobium salsuginis]|uniref:Glycogen synthase n=1 Tax=Halanaerobium salsuginis TaxID=29563 RepID=A0A1I4GL24_9FIRM|nr:glycogen synthase GlgA [Halanaerobium salsuginis]SFL30579.1 starch synthase [Halanaerobium salsuginis]
MQKKLKILFVASEADPFIKTGGLADVAGSLPQALREAGHDVRLVIPQYSQIPAVYKEKMQSVCHFRTQLAWRDTYLGVNQLTESGVPVYFIDNKYYFDRDSIYENEDRHEQFAFFCQAVLDMLPVLNFKPDIIHLNDWQTGPLPLLLADHYRQQNFYRDIKTVFTIHNLRYQGQFSGHIAADVLGVAPEHWASGKIRHNGLLNYMKTAIMYADQLTTVSETYAQEIQTAYFGEGLDYALRMRGDDLTGIINGLSYSKFNPETDSKIAVPYSAADVTKKLANKVHLQQKLGLEVDVERPIIGFISRLVEQKGIELIKAVFPQIMESGAQLVVLGTGQPEYEKFFLNQQQYYPDSLSVTINYNSNLASQIYAGIDLFLMPSRFEPCGLSQLISFRYGVLPIVRETGGLNDTVLSYNEATGAGTGFSFSNYNAHDMLHTIERAINFYQDEDLWHDLVQRVMKLDYSWHNSAQKYLSLYKNLMDSLSAKKSSTVSKKISRFSKNKTAIKVFKPEPAPLSNKNSLPEKTNLKRTKKKKESGQLVNINLATAAEFALLPGIGDFYAERIVAYRSASSNGFNKKTDLKKVKGIGKKKYKQISDLITL